MNQRVRSLDSVPRTRPQRTPPPAQTVVVAQTETSYTAPIIGLILNENIGRIPTIGIDSGAMPGTRPDQLY